MAKLMSKSELIQKIAAQHSNKMTRKDVKAVIESLAAIGYKELNRSGAFCAARICQIRCYQEAGNEGTKRHQSVHKRADDI